MSTTQPAASGWNLQHADKLFIDGQWRAPADASGRIALVCPDTEEVFAHVAEAREADMAAAVEAARRAFDQGPWPRLSPAERIAKVKELATALRAREKELAAAWNQQVGALAHIAPFMVAGGTANLDNAVAVAERFAFEAQTPTQNGIALLRRLPVGVVAAVTPWNVPYAIMTGKLGPALLAGCTVVMKPSPETPLEAYLIAECAEAVGFPAGVINLVPGHREAADFLVRHPGVDKVGFTGSTLAGRRIASVCGERIARCTLELGGKSAAILLDDFPVEQAGAMFARTISMLSGQVCAMLSRVIVPRAKHDALAEAVAAEMARIKVGPSTDPTSQMGPLAMGRQLARVQEYIAIGQAEGATLVRGGGRPAGLDRGFFIEPTLFANVDNRSRIAQEEIFGPVLSLIPADSEEHAIALANDSQFGLNGSVITTDAEAAYRVASQVRTGVISQGGMRADFKLPFGGFKQSGLGREGGAEGLMAYLETQTMLLDALPAALAGAPTVSP